jgi:DNA-binding NarL/FixJ family response regulator
VLELGVLEALGIGIVPAVLLARPATRVTLWRAGGPDAEPILPDQASDPASWTVGLVVTASGNAARAPRHRLTAREAEIVSAMAMGRTNAEIAHCLGVSTDTVKTHARRIFSRLDARDRAHAVAIALREGQIC